MTPKRVVPKFEPKDLNELRQNWVCKECHYGLSAHVLMQPCVPYEKAKLQLANGV